MPEEIISTASTESSTLPPPKKGFNPLLMLLNLFLWTLIIGVVMAIFGLVVYFTEDILGIEGFWGALVSFPIMGVIILFTFGFSGDFESGFGLAAALTIGGFIFWGILQIFGGIGIGILTGALILLCAFAVDLTNKEERTELAKDTAKTIAEDEAKSAIEQRTKFETKLAQLHGTKLLWHTKGSTTSLQKEDTSILASLQNKSNNEWVIDFSDGTQYQIVNSTLQFLVRGNQSEQPILTYHRSILGSDEKIELADGRKLALKRHQSKLILEDALLAWELHEGDTVLLRLEENASGGQITLAEHLPEDREIYLLGLAGVLAIKTFWSNVGAAGSVNTSVHLGS